MAPSAPIPVAVSFFEYLEGRWEHLLELSIEHATLTAVAVGVAIVIGVGVGAATHRHAQASTVALGLAGAILTIPSFALFALLIPLLGLGFKPAVVALVAYALLPIMRNTVTGLQGVDRAVVESARGMGMSSRQTLLRIELPLAWPVILAGIRVSTLLVLGIAAVAAVVNGPGLGNDIFAGLARLGSPVAMNMILAGTLGVVILALIFDGIYAVIGRLTVSVGIR
jgi:osmoprotectant transport system permease protein